MGVLDKSKGDASAEDPKTAVEAVEIRKLNDELTLRVQELAIANQRYDLAVAATTDGIWDWNIQTNDEYFSPRWCEILGYAHDDPALSHTYESWASKIHPEDRERVEDAVRAHLEHRAPYDVDYRHRHRSGEYRWQNSRGQAVFDEQGAPIRMVGAIRDINEHKDQAQQRIELETRLRAEALLRKSDERYRNLAEAAQDMIFMLTPDARLEYTNSYAAKTFGSPSDELVGRGLEELFPPDVVVGMRRSIIKVCTTGEPIDTERLREFSTGPPRWFSTRLVPIKDAEGNVTSVLGVSRDVTERKRLEERVKQTEKLESVGRLAGGVAHDFNNLLTSIIGFATFVQDALPPDDKRRDDIRQVLAAADRGVGLTQQLLTLARQTPTETETVDVRVTLEGIETLLRRTLGEDIELAIAVPSQPLYVLADPAQLDQIILNLAVNARDAMPQGGSLKITASVAHVESSDGPDSLTAGHTRIDVVDTGVGMDDATQARIFEPFFTTKGSTGGTGLGLATCYGVVTQLGGTIDVESRVGKGTTFCLRFPACDAPEEHSTPRSVEPPGLDGGETILVIEDEPAVRGTAERSLRQHGYKVLTAEDGIHGLEVFDAHKETIDLVLTDIVLPRGSGFDVAKEVRRKRPQVAVLLTSGYTDRQRIERDTAEFPIFWKPYTPGELVQHVRACLDERPLAAGDGRERDRDNIDA